MNGSSGTRSVPSATRVRRVAYIGGSGPDDKPGGRVRIDENKDDERERSKIFTENSLSDYVPLVDGELVSTACIQLRMLRHLRNVALHCKLLCIMCNS